jgi:hypothetical protein
MALNGVARGQRADALESARRALSTAETASKGPSPSAANMPRALSAMGLTYAALLKSRVTQPGDRDDAVSWLGKALDAWRTYQSDPTFGAPQRVEMREVEDALSALRARES